MIGLATMLIPVIIGMVILVKLPKVAKWLIRVIYTHRKKLSIIFSVTKAYKKSHFLSPDYTEI